MSRALLFTALLTLAIVLIGWLATNPRGLGEQACDPGSTEAQFTSCRKEAR